MFLFTYTATNTAVLAAHTQTHFHTFVVKIPTFFVSIIIYMCYNITWEPTNNKAKDLERHKDCILFWDMLSEFVISSTYLCVVCPFCFLYSKKYAIKNIRIVFRFYYCSFLGIFSFFLMGSIQILLAFCIICFFIYCILFLFFSSFLVSLLFSHTTF